MLDAFRYQVFVKMLAYVLLTCIGCTQQTAESGVSKAAMVTRTYGIADIIQGDEWTIPVPERIDQWIVCVTANVAPGSWNGNLGSIRAERASLFRTLRRYMRKLRCCSMTYAR